MVKAFRSVGTAMALLLLTCGAIFIHGRAPSAVQTKTDMRQRHVILISVDGLPPDYYTAPEKLGLRVPTLTVSIVDLTVTLSREATAEAINEAFRQAAMGALQGILGVTDEPLVSMDFRGDERSAIVDLPSTLVMGGRQIGQILVGLDDVLANEFAQFFSRDAERFGGFCFGIV